MANSITMSRMRLSNNSSAAGTTGISDSSLRSSEERQQNISNSLTRYLRCLPFQKDPEGETKMAELVSNYRDTSHMAPFYFPELAQRVHAVSQATFTWTHQHLNPPNQLSFSVRSREDIQPALGLICPMDSLGGHQHLNAFTPVDVLHALDGFVTGETVHIGVLCEGHLQMQRMLEEFGDSLDKKRRYITCWKIGSAVLFTVAAAASAGLAALAANIHPRRAAVAAGAGGASIVFLAAGKGVHSLLNKRENAVKKQKEITKAMNEAGQFATKVLGVIDVMLRGAKSSITNILEMIDGKATEVAVKEKFEDLIQSFQKLQIEANNRGQAVRSVTEAALHTGIRV